MSLNLNTEDNTYLSVDPVKYLNFRIDSLIYDIEYLKKQKNINEYTIQSDLFNCFYKIDKIKISFIKNNIHLDTQSYILLELSKIKENLYEHFFDNAIQILENIKLNKQFFRIEISENKFLQESFLKKELEKSFRK